MSGRAFRGEVLAHCAEAGGDFAVDVDENIEIARRRMHFDAQGVGHYEDAEIGDVLADWGRQQAVVAGDGAELERRQQFGLRVIPIVADALQLSGGPGKEIALISRGLPVRLATWR